jgi:hypothetical protein
VDQRKLAAVEINFCDRRQRAVRITSPSKEFAYRAKQMGPHGAAPSLKASMLIGEQLQTIMAIVSRM